MPSGHWHYNTYLSGGISVAFRKLAVNPKGLLKGIKFMTLTMPFDKTMNFFLGQNWFKKKEKMCRESCGIDKANAIKVARGELNPRPRVMNPAL